MNGAVWGFIGTLVGGFITFLSSWNAARTQTSRDLASRSEERRNKGRDELKAAYLRLLVVCRRLRTLARAGRLREQEEVDRLKSELSAATYEIGLIAPMETFAVAEELAQAVRSYVNEAGTQFEQLGRTEDSEELRAKRTAAREHVDRFMERARLDLEEEALTRRVGR